jgi:hypothetical protein
LEEIQQPIILQIDHRLSEHVQAERLYYARHSKFASVDRIVAAALLLVGIVSTALVGLHWWTAIWFLLAPLEFFDLLSIAPLVVSHRFKKTAKFHELNELEFTEDGIYFRTPTIDSRLKWEIYSEVIDNDDLILLVLGNQMYSVLPKRCFKNDEDIGKLLTMARKMVTSAVT